MSEGRPVPPPVRQPAEPIQVVVPDAVATARHGWSRAALAVMIAVVAFALCTQLIGAWYRSAHGVEGIPVLGAKLSVLLETADRYDLIFLGSSRTYREFDAPAFDAAMAASGCPLRSFNMGIAGLNVVELRYLVKRLAAARGARLPWLLVEELPPVRVTSFGNERSRFFMRPSNLLLSLRDIATAGIPLGRRLRIAGLVTYGYGFEAAATGMLAAGVPRLGSDTAAREYWSQADTFERAGFVPLDLETAGQFEARRRALAASGETFASRLEEAARVSSAPPGDVPAGRLAFLAETLGEAHAALADRVTLVLMPQPQQVAYYRGLEAQADELGYPLINLNDFGRYSWLGERELWFDDGHLGASGAARLSRALAERLCPVGGH